MRSDVLVLLAALLAVGSARQLTSLQLRKVASALEAADPPAKPKGTDDVLKEINRRLDAVETHSFELMVRQTFGSVGVVCRQLESYLDQHLKEKEMAENLPAAEPSPVSTDKRILELLRALQADASDSSADDDDDDDDDEYDDERRHLWRNVFVACAVYQHLSSGAAIPEEAGVIDSNDAAAPSPSPSPPPAK